MTDRQAFGQQEQQAGLVPEQQGQEPQEARRNHLPVGKNEDVEYAAELADADDLEAAQRAEMADQRQSE